MVMYKNINGVLLLLFLSSVCYTCPPVCVCKWKNGKQTVECTNKELLAIPGGIDPTTQVLNVSGNNFRALHHAKFLKMDLINLQRIYLSRCHMFSIDNQTFKGLTNLVELDLSHNSLQAIPSAAFVYCLSLMKLTLNGNPIKALQRTVFSHLSYLSSLELSNCEISTVDEEAFRGLHSLEWLYLDGNKMSSFAAARNLPSSLKGVQLHENPWECDCNILELHGWLLAFSFPLSVEPVCKGPSRLSGHTIKSVPHLELACIADISPTAFYLEIEEGRNISLLCQIHAVPEAEIAWSFEGQVLQNESITESTTRLVYYLEKGNIQKQSELFIYNANWENNGTYVCSAENPAGISHANYTIRVMLKENTDNMSTEEIPIELVLLVTSSLGVAGLLLIVVVILSIIKCHRQNIPREHQNNKTTLQESPLDKTTSLLETKAFSNKTSTKSIIKLNDRKDTTMSLLCYNNLQLNHKYLKPALSLPTANQIISLPLETYHPKRNPDLINGTESILRIGNGAITENYTPFAHTVSHNIPECNLCVPGTDVRLNPIGLLNAGNEVITGNCYQTLPYKKHAAAVPSGGYCKEAEILCKAGVFYDHYDGIDVRYTADGYPVRKNADSACSSPSASNKSSGSQTIVIPCCSAKITSRPQCICGNLGKQESQAKKSVSSQTQTESLGEISKIDINKHMKQLVIYEDNVQL